MSEGTPGDPTLGTKLRIYQETFGLDDASLIAKSVDQTKLAQLQRGEIDTGNLDALGQIARDGCCYRRPTARRS